MKPFSIKTVLFAVKKAFLAVYICSPFLSFESNFHEEFGKIQNISKNSS